MSQTDQDKSDPASAYKLQKAREQGSVAKSQDLTFLAVLFGMTCCVFGMGPRITQDLAKILAQSLSLMSRRDWDVAATSQVLGDLMVQVLQVLAAPIAVVAVLVVVASVWQVGFTVSTEPLKPDFSRINPAEGFKKLFSLRSLYDLLRSCIKLAAVALLVMFAANGILREVVVLPFREVASILAYLQHKLGVVLAAMTALFAFLAAADLAYTRWEFLKKMRMSKREVKDEHKQREGDPRIKSRLRELRLEWLKKSMTAKRVKDADILVTNPTHYAVAIAYKRDSMPAPKILAKGSGEMALRMRKVAAQYNVTIVENPPLARALYKLANPDDFLPQEHYADVAKILVWVFAARQAQQNRITKGSATP